jgi:preprotein translocase subunit SecD
MHLGTPLAIAMPLALALFCAGCSQSLPPAAVAAQSCPTIEIAEIVAADAHGARQFHATDGAAVSVSADSLVTTADIADVRPATAEGHQVLEIDLGASSAAALRAFSASHVGTRVAFIVNHSVRRMARILDPISGEGLIIDPVTASEAGELVGCVHARPAAPGA